MNESQRLVGMMAEMFKRAEPGHIRSGMWSYVVNNGKPFGAIDIEASIAVRDVYGLKRQQCYKNCQLVAQIEDEEFEYFEGYALSVIPVEHAWLVRSGKVVDPTWADETCEDYFGIHIPTPWIKKRWLRTKLADSLMLPYAYEVITGESSLARRGSGKRTGSRQSKTP